MNRKKIASLILATSIITAQTVVPVRANDINSKSETKFSNDKSSNLKEGKELLINGSFENPKISSTLDNEFFTSIPGWKSNDSFEIGNTKDYYIEPIIPNGKQILELNSTDSNNEHYIYQDIQTTPGEKLTFSFYYHARPNTNENKISLQLGSPGKLNFKKEYTANLSWQKFSGEYIVPEGQTTTRLKITSIAPPGGKSVGNLLDDISLKAIDSEIVNIPDPNFKKVLNRSIHGNVTDAETDDDEITVNQLGKLTQILRSNVSGIENIEGVQYCTNLKKFELYSENISDITLLKNLTNLTYITVEGNKISDISPLSNLRNLTYLNIGSNKISDISPLANLSKLSELSLDNQRITGQEVTAVGSNATVNNIVKNVNGSLIAPTNSNSYSYNSNTGQITFNNITITGNKSYDFSTNVTVGQANATFSGSVTQNVLYTVNKSELKKLLDEDIDTFGMTPESVRVYEDALARGKKVYNNAYADQNRVDKVVRAIKDAKRNLKPDKSGLQQAINNAKDKLANGNLTPSSKNKLNQAIS
ncbi:MAG: leucine-rich repeat domain-containing protein, partial [Clostridium sp.]|nr:leucine-rich repeat domain-containing protein [Clostridium sp.]